MPDQFNLLGGVFVTLLPYLEEAARFSNYDPTKNVDDPVNLPITSLPVDIYTCPSMRLPRAVPSGPDEKLGPGSYIISTRTEYGMFNNLDGAFANPTSDGHYSLGFKNITDGTSKTLLVGETNFGLQAWRWEDGPDIGTPDVGRSNLGRRILDLSLGTHGGFETAGFTTIRTNIFRQNLRDVSAATIRAACNS